MNDLEPRCFPFQLFDRLANRHVFRRTCERNDLIGFGVERHADVRESGQEGLHDGQRLLGVRGLNLVRQQLRLLDNRLPGHGFAFHIDLFDQFLKNLLFILRPGDEHPRAGGINGNTDFFARIGVLAQSQHGAGDGQHLFGRHEFQADNVDSLLSGTLGRLDDVPNHPQSRGRFGHQDLPRLGHDHHLASWAQQLLDFLFRVRCLHAGQMEHGFDQFKFAPLVELFDRHELDQHIGYLVVQIHDHQQPAAANQRVTTWQQHAID